MKSHSYPIFEHESIDSVTFRTINKLAHYLKMFQLKFAAATTITVEISKLQCQMIHFFETFLMQKGLFFKIEKNKIFFDDFV